MGAGPNFQGGPRTCVLALTDFVYKVIREEWNEGHWQPRNHEQKVGLQKIDVPFYFNPRIKQIHNRIGHLKRSKKLFLESKVQIWITIMQTYSNCDHG